MAYCPPIAHYRHFRVPEAWKLIGMGKIVGKDGKNFILATERSGAKYIWHNVQEDRVEIWGPHGTLMRAERMIKSMAKKISFSLDVNIQ